MEIYKIIGVALAGVVLVMVVRPVQPQVAVLLSLATGVALLWMTLSQLETVVGFLRELAEGSGLKLFNANSATLGETLAMGCAGFSGVLANFHPALYRALWDRRLERGAVYEALAALLSVLSGVERGSYPANAKYHMSLTATPMGTRTRSLGLDELPLLQRREMEDLLRVERAAMAQLLP